MDRIQSKDHNIRSYKINEIYLPSCGGEKYILEDGYDRLLHIHKSTH